MSDAAPNSTAAPPIHTGRMRAKSVSQRLQEDFIPVTRPRAATIAVSQPRLPIHVGFIAVASSRNDEGRADTATLQSIKPQEADILDVVDPKTSSASYLTNISNAIALPPNIPWLTRKPVVKVEPIPNDASDSDSDRADAVGTDEAFQIYCEQLGRESKKELAKRAWKGFLAFAKTPLGVFFIIYGILVVFWGAALVLILVTAIPMPSKYRRDVWVEICSQILNGLFTLTGVGMIPFRLRDTYWAYIMWRYAHLIRVERRHQGLPELADKNDLPLQPRERDLDTPPAVEDTKSALVLVPDEHDPECGICTKRYQHLWHAQDRFSKSQTWYRPHETPTHHAFPLNIALTICLLNDGNSFFQVLLCVAMWGWNWHKRPAWTTGCLIPLSFGCGIASALLIWQYGKRTKKWTAVELAIQQAAKERRELEAKEHQHDAIHKILHFHTPTQRPRGL